MHLYDMPWISHDGGSIFSLDMHPTGSKLATAGQDGAGAGLLVIWDLQFVSAINPADPTPPEYNQSPLARIPHSSSINCVRWSKQPETRRLACAGDDPVLCIYECTGVYTSMGSFHQHQQQVGQPMKSRCLENYKCSHKLFGHTLDVLHLDWSPDGKYLASCSLDNTIIIWNVLKLPEKITVLREPNGGHLRGVKGLAWDPIGRYLSTQAEDNTLKIWQTDNWSCVRTLSEPFSESAISTLFYRMDWSPDGCYLLAPCAMNNGGPTAKIVVRRDWSYSRDLVGFRKAVSCVRANPHCFQRTNSSGTHSTISCFAVGSRDRSLSIWLVPNFGRPMLVLEKLFKDSLIDLSWSKLTLAACSRDGVVRLLKFTDSEIGHMLSAHEMAAIHERIYGIRPALGLPEEESQNHGGREEVSADFGFTSICEAITRRARETEIRDRDELFRLAFNVEPPRKRISDEQLQRIVQRCKKQRRLEHRSQSSTSKSNSGGLTNARDENEHHKPARQLSDNQLCRRKECGKEEDSSGSDPWKQLFELPERRRLFMAKIEPGNEASTKIEYVGVINNYPLRSHAEPEITRVVAFPNGEHKPDWVFYSPHLVSHLAANSRWTILATFNARLIALSTRTGRLLFETSLEEPLAGMQMDGASDLCLTIGLAGTLSIWEIPTRHRLLNKSIRELFKYPTHQLISASVTKLPESAGNSNENGRADVQVKLTFSDQTIHEYCPELDGWTTKQDLKPCPPTSRSNLSKTDRSHLSWNRKSRYMKWGGRLAPPVPTYHKL